MPKESSKNRPGVSRRGFLGSVGAGVFGATVAGDVQASPIVQAAVVGEPVEIALLINGRQHKVRVEPRLTLLDVLREKLGLVGTKLGCERGECGACTILFDGVARYACLTLALEAEGHEITTIEGVMRGEELGPVQKAFVEEDAFQCGKCTPGQVMSAEALLRKDPSPSTETIRESMSGNLCRCGAYHHIVKAVQRASELKRRQAR